MIRGFQLCLLFNTMAPDLKQIEKQTYDILEHLFSDGVSTVRYECYGDIEPDGPEDDFDPVLIADKLKRVADTLNKDPRFQAKLKELKQEAAKEALDQALSCGIDALAQTQVGRNAEVAPELDLIKATVAFGLYMKKTCPDLRDQLQSAIGHFLNQRVGPWITQQGGWEQVAAVSQL